MEIRNKHWLPIVDQFKHMARDVDKVSIVYMEDEDVAGMFDPDDKHIVVNIAPNVLAGVAERYNLRPRELERVALSVFIEECAHSRGIEDEGMAVMAAKAVTSQVTDQELMEGSGMVGYANAMLKASAHMTA